MGSRKDTTRVKVDKEDSRKGEWSKVGKTGSLRSAATEFCCYPEEANFSLSGGDRPGYRGNSRWLGRNKENRLDRSKTFQGMCDEKVSLFARPLLCRSSIDCSYCGYHRAGILDGPGWAGENGSRCGNTQEGCAAAKVLVVVIVVVILSNCLVLKLALLCLALPCLTLAKKPNREE